MRDGTVTFKCSSNHNLWPWLTLPPFNPIVVQSINYWASVETGAARGTFDPSVWSALTQMEWTCGHPDAGHVSHGVAAASADESSPGYQLTFFDKTGAFVYHMSGTGVVFKTRDFESWRQKAKQKLEPFQGSEDFQYASADDVGVATQGESFLSPLIEGGIPCAEALITKAQGFTPKHPYHSGSGDHVNSNHLADVAVQFANLLFGGSPITVVGGEMTFQRYVELGRPFHIGLAEEIHSGNAISMTIMQMNRVCATVTIRY